MACLLSQALLSQLTLHLHHGRPVLAIAWAGAGYAGALAGEGVGSSLLSLVCLYIVAHRLGAGASHWGPAHGPQAALARLLRRGHCPRGGWSLFGDFCHDFPVGPKM